MSEKYTQSVIDRANNLITLLKENENIEMANRVQDMMDSSLYLFHDLKKRYPYTPLQTPEQKKALAEAYEIGVCNIDSYLCACNIV